MILLDISPSVWIVWIIIGLITGYMSFRLLIDGPPLLIGFAAALLGSVLGGWLFVHFVGGEDNDIYLSLLTSLALSGIMLWIAYILFRRRVKKE